MVPRELPSLSILSPTVPPGAPGGGRRAGTGAAFAEMLGAGSPVVSARQAAAVRGIALPVEADAAETLPLPAGDTGGPAPGVSPAPASVPIVAAAMPSLVAVALAPSVSPEPLVPALRDDALPLRSTASVDGAAPALSAAAVAEGALPIIVPRATARIESEAGTVTDGGVADASQARIAALLAPTSERAGAIAAGVMPGEPLQSRRAPPGTDAMPDTGLNAAEPDPPLPLTGRESATPVIGAVSRAPSPVTFGENGQPLEGASPRSGGHAATPTRTDPKRATASRADAAPSRSTRRGQTGGTERGTSAGLAAQLSGQHATVIGQEASRPAVPTDGSRVSAGSAAPPVTADNQGATLFAGTAAASRADAPARHPRPVALSDAIGADPTASVSPVGSGPALPTTGTLGDQVIATAASPPRARATGSTSSTQAQSDQRPTLPDAPAFAEVARTETVSAIATFGREANATASPMPAPGTLSQVSPGPIRSRSGVRAAVGDSPGGVSGRAGRLPVDTKAVAGSSPAGPVRADPNESPVDRGTSVVPLTSEVADRVSELPATGQKGIGEASAPGATGVASTIGVPTTTPPSLASRLPNASDPAFPIAPAQTAPDAAASTSTVTPKPAGAITLASSALPTPPANPAPALAAAVVPAPAGRVFAAALHLAAMGEDRRRFDDALAPLSGTAPLASPGVAAVAQGTAPAIDLSDRRWPAQMIERIEAMRDDADATSTRVRFAPDALGPVDVHVRRDGASVHLHFTAAQDGTRALLQDARPELARLAAERGLKLGDSSVDGGGAQPQRRAATPTPARFAAPARGATSDTADDPADTRIA